MWALGLGLAWAAVDNDGDGADAAIDCNDRDATIYPGAPELPNGVDDDCDGVVDDGTHPGTGTGDTGGRPTGDTGAPARPTGDTGTPAPPTGDTGANPTDTGPSTDDGGEEPDPDEGRACGCLGRGFGVGYAVVFLPFVGVRRRRT